VPAQPNDTFDGQALLNSAEMARSIVEYRRGGIIFSQGDPWQHVFYLQAGRIKLSVVSRTGREAVVAMLGPREFFGEGCLAEHAIHMGTATATEVSRVLMIDKDHMRRLLQTQQALSDRFIAHLLARSLRVEEDLIDQLFNTSEKRLARTLLLLAHYSTDDPSVGIVPRISQETLADMVGTTRSRVNFFMRKFQRLGLIDYTDGLKVTNALLSAVLRD
jgi:CRP/FNR family transcriptional regulator, cyclic AMP receptor protein